MLLRGVLGAVLRCELAYFYSSLFLDSRVHGLLAGFCVWFSVLGCVGMLLGCVADLK